MPGFSATALGLFWLVTAPRAQTGAVAPAVTPAAPAAAPGGPAAPGVTTAPAPTIVATQPQPGRWTVFPLVTFAPETSLQLSAFVIYSFALSSSGSSPGAAAPTSSPRQSNVSLVAAYTLKNQFVVAMSPTLYLADGAWRVSGSGQALWFPDVFFEPGADSPADSMEKYTQRAFVVFGGVERRVFGHLRIGGQGTAVTADMTEVEPGGRLAAGELAGSTGGTGYGIGPVVSWDDRHREFNPQHGGRHTLSVSVYPRIGNATFSYTQATLDLRQYLPTWWTGHVVALQVYSQLTRGDVPFQLMPTLAGDSRMRGFFASRYRDRHTISGQLEYRAAVWWRLGLVAFGGVGDVAHRLEDFDLSHFRAAAGGGLRVALDQKDGINLRLDIGHTTTGDTNVYLALGEGF